jgi:hypothetical protein
MRESITNLGTCNEPVSYMIPVASLHPWHKSHTDLIMIPGWSLFWVAQSCKRQALRNNLEGLWWYWANGMLLPPWSGCIFGKHPSIRWTEMSSPGDIEKTIWRHWYESTGWYTIWHWLLIEKISWPSKPNTSSGLQDSWSDSNVHYVAQLLCISIQERPAKIWNFRVPCIRPWMEVSGQIQSPIQHWLGSFGWWGIGTTVVIFVPTGTNTTILIPESSASCSVSSVSIS